MSLRPLPEFLKRDLGEWSTLALLGPLAIAVAALSGIGHRWIDILAQFPAPALIATLVWAMILAVAGLRRAAGMAAAVALLLLIALWPQWFPTGVRPQPGAPVVRLYSANLYYLNQDVGAIRRSIEAADPDVVVLIELGAGPADRIDQVLAGYPYRVASVVPDETRGPARSMIASRWPLTPVPDNRDGLHDVIAVVRTPLGPINVVGVHLTRPWPYQYQWGQITQASALAAARRELRGPVIVAGDFNSVSSARIGRQIRRETGLLPAPGFPGTWPAGLPPLIALTIDQVYRSPDLAIVSRRVGRPNGSDHRPVVTEITRAMR